MYLKSLQMTGFKSFMRKTQLDFEPGMTAIVGPNGCGKSNISDAMRWVLGEQSAKALRGSKMEDVIFNGTDSRRPLGMSEVSVTFADCDQVLDTEFNEVTITRRVLRSGEGQYFLNKRPCRLKDIHRMFMDTGVGTRSYSVLEQGRIDQILSQRPEDRRMVFEEASGITKYKADKNEALRKLEQTEANLLRLADVIREVKRQIGSLQRQAGKACRYKSMRDELQVLDVYATRNRLQAFDRDLSEIDAESTALKERVATAHAEIEKLEQDNTGLRQVQMDTEREVGTVLEASVQSRSRLEHTRELIAMNDQRIAEYRTLSERDSREIEDAQQQITHRHATLESLTEQLRELDGHGATADEDLARDQAAFEGHREQIESTRRGIQELREQIVELESQASRLQNHLTEIETRERASVVRRERLTAEKLQLTRAAEAQGQRKHEMAAALKDLEASLATGLATAAEAESDLTACDAALRDAQEHCAQLRSDAAAKNARLDLLSEDADDGSDFPPGSQQVLDHENPLELPAGAVLGALATHLDVDHDYQRALEAALRAWLDAVVVSTSETARVILDQLAARQGGSTRLLIAGLDVPPLPQTDGDRLLSHVRSDEALQPLLNGLLGDVVVVDRLDQVPSPTPCGCRYVTRDGRLLQGPGIAELWMPESHVSNPLARQYAMDEARKAVEALARELQQADARIAECSRAREAAVERLATARERVTEAQRVCAQKEGEVQVVTAEAEEAKRRLETVGWELESLVNDTAAGQTERQETAERLEGLHTQRESSAQILQRQTRALQELEDRSGELQSRLTESRIRSASLRQKRENVTSQRDAVALRVEELEAAVRGRSEGLQGYESSIARLEDEVAAARTSITELEAAVKSHADRAASLRRNQQKQAEELKAMEADLTRKRSAMEALREGLSSLDVRRTESRMNRQSLVDRVTGDYRITIEEVMAEPEEEPDPPLPPMEEAETRVAELRTKLEAMGPVNLVAIEEYQELETRFAFLTEQEADLVKSKQQLMDMIRRISRTTSEMFRTTFDKVNENFSAMFKQLFRGGSAKLVLVDEEDLLECGIEIIARPPGKRLQNVSLLSGGERTLTAVALLFAIYMIRPSPFCVLDELDAALDDSNIGRFVTILKGFLDQSQFVVITHNRQTIAAADVLYGVTMQEKGVSNVVSMKFSEAAAHEDWVTPETVQKDADA